MTPEQQRIAQLEYELHGLRRDASLFVLFGIGILPNFLHILLSLVPKKFDFDFPKRLIVSIALTFVVLFVRRMVLNARQARSTALQRQQDFIESVPELNKSP